MRKNARIINYCIDCGKQLSKAKYIRCRKCSHQGSLHNQYIDGRTLIKNHCIDCQKIISYDAHRCQSCHIIYANKLRWKNLNG